MGKNIRETTTYALYVSFFSFSGEIYFTWPLFCLLLGSTKICITAAKEIIELVAVRQLPVTLFMLRFIQEIES